MNLASVNLMQLAPKAAKTCDIKRNDGHLAVQCHSRTCHRFWYLLKACMRLLLVNNTNFHVRLISHRFSYRGTVVKLSLLKGEAYI